MADITYEYNAWSSNNGWANPDYAVDGQQGDEAVASQEGGPGASGKLRVSATDSPGTNLGTITKVEFGSYHSGDFPTNQFVGQAPGGSMFGGILNGQPSALTWYDVSEELSGADISDWSWSLTQTQDFDIWLWNDFIGPNTIRVDQVYLRITYDEITGPANVAKVGPIDSANISKIDGIDWTSVRTVGGV
jgi:hypothetical protein